MKTKAQKRPCSRILAGGRLDQRPPLRSLVSSLPFPLPLPLATFPFVSCAVLLSRPDLVRAQAERAHAACPFVSGSTWKIIITIGKRLASRFPVLSNNFYMAVQRVSGPRLSQPPFFSAPRFAGFGSMARPKANAASARSP